MWTVFYVFDVFTYLKFSSDFWNAPYLTYLTCLHIWDFPQNFRMSRIWRIWRVYVFEIFPKKLVPRIWRIWCVYVFEMVSITFLVNRIWRSWRVYVFEIFPQKMFATYLTYSRVYVFEIFPKIKLGPVFDVFMYLRFSPFLFCHVFTCLRI